MVTDRIGQSESCILESSMRFNCLISNWFIQPASRRWWMRISWNFAWSLWDYVYRCLIYITYATASELPVEEDRRSRRQHKTEYLLLPLTCIWVKDRNKPTSESAPMPGSVSNWDSGIRYAHPCFDHNPLLSLAVVIIFDICTCI